MNSDLTTSGKLVASGNATGTQGLSFPNCRVCLQLNGLANNRYACVPLVPGSTSGLIRPAHGSNANLSMRIAVQCGADRGQQVAGEGTIIQ